jgi:hypothetical protein
MNDHIKIYGRSYILMDVLIFMGGKEEGKIGGR